MKSNNALLLLSILGLLSLSTAALADAPNYDYAELGYQSISDPATSSYDSDHAYILDGSYAMTDRWILVGSYGHEKADLNVPGLSGSASGDAYSLGVGYRIPLTGSVDLVPNLAYDSDHATSSASYTPGGTTSYTQINNNYDLGLALRAMVAPQFELDANFDHIAPSTRANTLGVAAVYDFTPSFAIGAGYASEASNGQTTTGWTVVFRWYFK